MLQWRLLSGVCKLESSRNKFLEYLTRVVLLGRSLEFGNIGRTVPTNRVLRGVRIIQILELSESSNASQISAESANGIIGNFGNGAVEFRIGPR